MNIATMTAPQLWRLAELALDDYRWRTALDALNELGQRFDDLYTRAEHVARTATYSKPHGDLLPCTRSLNACESELPPAFASRIDDAVNDINRKLMGGV